MKRATAADRAKACRALQHVFDQIQGYAFERPDLSLEGGIALDLIPPGARVPDSGELKSRVAIDTCRSNWVLLSKAGILARKGDGYHRLNRLKDAFKPMAGAHIEGAQVRLSDLALVLRFERDFTFLLLAGKLRTAQADALSLWEVYLPGTVYSVRRTGHVIAADPFGPHRRR